MSIQAQSHVDQVAPLEKAIRIIGSKTQLAKLLNIKPQFITQWLSCHRPIPLERALQIEKLTGVKASQLCPYLMDRLRFLK